MTVFLTADLIGKLLPRAPQTIKAAFVAKQSLLAEILETSQRLALAFANIYAETSGYALAGLTENIRYTAQQMANEWPNRFHRNAAEVTAKYGTAPGWQIKAFDDIYCRAELGNRPGTHDGSDYIGRGGPQLTGRIEYTTIGSIIGVDLAAKPQRACDADLQPDILAAYWRSKNFSKYADAGNIVQARKIWNGGTNGLDVVQAQYPKLLKIIAASAPTTAATVVKAPTATNDEHLAVIQKFLIDFGYHEVGTVDGLIGAKTIGAIAAFCVDRGIASLQYPNEIDAINKACCDAFNAKWHRPVAPARAFATTEQLAPKIASVAPTKRAALFSKLAGWGGTGSAMVGGAVQFMPTAHDNATPYIAMMHEYFDKVPGWLPLACIGGFALAASYHAVKANKATTADYQQGKIN